MGKFDFNYNRQKLTLKRAKYKNDHIAIVIVNVKTGERWGELTCNTTQFDVPGDKFPIKTWGKNENIVEVIYNTKLFNDTQIRANSNDVSVEFWEFNKPLTIEDMPILKN